MTPYHLPKKSEEATLRLEGSFISSQMNILQKKRTECPNTAIFLRIWKSSINSQKQKKVIKSMKRASRGKETYLPDRHKSAMWPREWSDHPEILTKSIDKAIGVAKWKSRGNSTISTSWHHTTYTKSEEATPSRLEGSFINSQMNGSTNTRFKRHVRYAFMYVSYTFILCFTKNKYARN